MTNTHTKDTASEDYSTIDASIGCGLVYWQSLRTAVRGVVIAIAAEMYLDEINFNVLLSSGPHGNYQVILFPKQSLSTVLIEIFF